MAEGATNETVAFLISIVREALEDTKEFWGTLQEDSHFLALVNVAATGPFVSLLRSLHFTDDLYQAMSLPKLMIVFGAS